jgi:hypothetical protein
MKLKRVFILLAVLTSVGNAYSQRGFQNLKEYDYEPYHFGFLLGYNQMGFSLQQNTDVIYSAFRSTSTSFLPADYNSKPGESASLTSVEPKPTPGFTIGIVGSLRVSDHFDLRCIPSLSFGERDLVYNYITLNPNIPIDTMSEVQSIKSTMLELPLDLKYKGDRINNMRPYILGGIKYVMDLSSDAKKKTDLSGVFVSKLKQSDLYGELGAGFDLYFDWFKMGIEAKMSYGLRDILVRDTPSMYTTSINRLNSKVFQLSLTFE